MTPEQFALLVDARRLLLVLAPLCAHLPPGKRAAHLAGRCTELAGRIERSILTEGA